MSAKPATVSRARMYEVIRAPLITEKTTNGSEHGQVTFRVPVRKHWKHVWSFWRGVTRPLKAALAARYRPARKADPPPRLRPCAGGAAV